MTNYDIDPAWRTATVVELCRSMRAAQDWSALPILADALEDADCGAADLLRELRGPAPGYARGATLVACVMSAATAESAGALAHFADAHDCPDYHTLLAAAAGRHEENDGDDGYRFSEVTDWGADAYLHFNGFDAHGPIPPEFWDLVEAVTGKTVGPDDRPAHFSCSC